MRDQRQEAVSAFKALSLGFSLSCLQRTLARARKPEGPSLHLEERAWRCWLVEEGEDDDGEARQEEDGYGEEEPWTQQYYAD